MTIAKKLQTIAENEQRVFDAGYEKGKNEGGNTEEVYNKGVADGKQAQYDEFWDKFQNYGNRTYYGYAFAGNCWHTDLLKPKYPIVLPNTSGCNRAMFAYMNRFSELEESIDLEHITKMIDFSACVDASDVFIQSSIKNIYADFSNCTVMYRTFSNGDGAQKLDNIYIKVSDKCTSFNNTFAYTT